MSEGSSKASGAPVRHRSWLLFGVIGVAGVILAAAMVFLAVNLADEEPPPALYTAADLPELPPDEQNGWVMLRDAPPPRGSRADEARAHAGKALSSKMSLAAFAASRVEADGAMTAAVGRCRLAYRAPRFVDACPMAVHATCPHLVVHHCHRLLIHEALAAAATGRVDEAIALTDRLLAASLEHAQTGRGLLGQAVGQRNLEESLGLLERLADWLSPEALSAPLDRLAAADFDSLRIELALVGEYLVMMRSFEEMKHASAKERWLFDVGATRKVVDEAFERAAQGGSLSIAPRTENTLWWFHNPVGKLLLDALAPTGHAWDEMRERDRSLREKRASLLSHSSRGGSRR